VSQADYRNAAWALRLASDRVVAVADVIANRLGNACQAGVETTVIRNAVTPGHVVDRETARKELNIPLDTPVALCLARMEPQKRHDVLLDAWARMPGNELLLIAGDGSRRAALEVAARPMGDRVRFLGNRSDVPTLLAAADVTVLTSDWEGLPMAVLESLAARRPAVATAVDGVREVLAPGGGRLVAPGDAAAIASALRELLHDHAARELAAEIGLATIRHNYDAAAMVDRYDEVVRQMLSSKAVRRIPPRLLRKDIPCTSPR